jgi:hypothetical protein
METQQCIPFMLIQVYVALNNIKVFSIAMDMQQWIPFALLFSQTTFRHAVNNKYRIL